MKVEYYVRPSGRSPIEDFILGLSTKDQGRFYDVFEGIQNQGLECPRVKFRQLSGKLWEMKFKGEGCQYRIAYVLVEREAMVWLHVFKKKTKKTPKDDLELAMKRMMEVMS
jgi:phage-related protein